MIDPARGRDEVADLWISDEGIIQDGPVGGGTPKVVRAEGRLITPGFLDLHVHLRDPGDEAAETLQTGGCAAAHGGVTAVVAMPNTHPPLDRPERVRRLLNQATAYSPVTIFPCACLTMDRAGRVPAPLVALRAAGAVAFSDDGAAVADESVMEAAMAEAAALGVPVFDHAIDPNRAGDGVMRDGPTARRLGWTAIPSDAEPIMVQRDLRLAQQTGCRLHLQHLSCAESVRLLRKARDNGLAVTAEATPHHLTLTEEDVERLGALAKMNPPLGTPEDRDSLVEAVVDGTIEVIATDHAPHTTAAKALGMEKAPFGVIGLETAAAVTYGALVESGRMTVLEWVRRWTTGPARVLGMISPSLEPGRPADVTVWDVTTEWIVEPEKFLSKSRNTPFTGWRLRCRSVLTLRRGCPVWVEAREF